MSERAGQLAGCCVLPTHRTFPADILTHTQRHTHTTNHRHTLHVRGSGGVERRRDLSSDPISATNYPEDLNGVT